LAWPAHGATVRGDAHVRFVDATVSYRLALTPETPHPAVATAMNTSAPHTLPPLACRYLLAIHVPLYIDRQGRPWTERLWWVDLQRHTNYIRNLTVACPFIHAEPPADCVPVDEGAIRFEPVAWQLGAAASLLRAPWTLWQLLRLIERHDFVHSIYGGWWPLATPYLVNAVARRRGKCLMVNVEASPWRLVRGEQASAWRRWQAGAAERFNLWTVSLADIAFFTHEGYRRDLMPRHPERGHVIHASWIDEAVVLSADAARARWQARLQAPAAPLRLLLAGRLQDDKGIRVLLEALQRLRAEGRTRVQVAIIGAGPLEGLCREHAARSDERVQLELLDPVPYGEALFALLRRFDALLVPSLADEQPRVVYDAYSQALPVLASATPGLRTCVTDGITGRLFTPADAQALAAAIGRAAREPAALQALGLAALEAARTMTHQDMHRRRHALIAAALAARGLA
jgi:glycosyltransferase involved in cell wall biosynthesis